jgi:hypothetical protein
MKSNMKVSKSMKKEAKGMMSEQKGFAKKEVEGVKDSDIMFKKKGSKKK